MCLENPEITICDDIDGISARAANVMAGLASDAIAKSGIFTVALSGGSTPDSLYRLLGTDECRDRIDWRKVHIFWGDERCVLPDNPESNYHMALGSLLSRVNIPGKNIHRIKGERGADAAGEYEEEIRGFFCLEEGELPLFDLILLGMGDDGHTASIFPGTVRKLENLTPHYAKKKGEGVIAAAVYVEKLKSTRITLTPSVINFAENVIFLVSGENKATALREVLEGDYLPDLYPAQLVRRSGGRVMWLLDMSAAKSLSIKGL